jgi:hypothetical protein
LLRPIHFNRGYGNNSRSDGPSSSGIRRGGDECSFAFDDPARSEVEARIVVELDHPAVVPIYEFGEHDGPRFFSLKYL